MAGFVGGGKSTETVEIIPTYRNSYETKVTFVGKYPILENQNLHFLKKPLILIPGKPITERFAIRVLW